MSENMISHYRVPPGRPRKRRPSEEERERDRRECAENVQRNMQTELGVRRMIAFIAVLLPVLLWASAMGDWAFVLND